MKVTVIVPVRTVSALNVREHWAAKARRAKEHRAATTLAWRADVGRRKVPLPALVTLTRIGPRDLDDDNLAGALKHVRDQVAAQLGIDDADPLVVWRNRQERGKRGHYAVRVEIVRRSPEELRQRAVGESDRLDGAE